MSNLVERFRLAVSTHFKGEKDETGKTQYPRYAEDLATMAEVLHVLTRGDSARIDWIESQIQQYGNGHDEPCEASWHFQWQQEKPADYWPGLREWIDQEMKNPPKIIHFTSYTEVPLDDMKIHGPCLRCNGAGGERWMEVDGSENGETCPRCGGFGSEP